MATFAQAVSPGFDPDVHLRRIGVANQTTMLARESLAIGEEVGAAIARARGDEARATDFRSFDTICSATQERQDAVRELLDEPRRRDGRDRRLQLEQHDLARRAVRRARADVPHRGRRRRSIPRRGPIHFRRAGVKHSEADAVDWLPARPGARRHHRGREHAEQQDRRDGGANLCDSPVWPASCVHSPDD